MRVSGGVVSGIRAAAAAVVLVGISLVVPGSATAAVGDRDDAGGSITWSVRPGDATGPDGRAWIELDADPGDDVVEHLVVTNHSRREVEFRLLAADGYFTETGRFNMLPSDHESTAAGTWIDLPPTVTVGPGRSKIVSMTIAVPSDATPGDNPAGVAASIVSGEGEIGVESRVGFRVMTRVSGALRPELSLGGSGRYVGSWNPFEAGRLEIDYQVENAGNIRLGGTSTIEASAMVGTSSSSVHGPEIAELAPGDVRSSTTMVPRAWPVLAYTVEIQVKSTDVTGAMDLEVPIETVSFTVWAVPWLHVGLLVAGLVAVDRRRRNRRARRELDQELAQLRRAAEEGPKIQHAT